MSNEKTKKTALEQAMKFRDIINNIIWNKDVIALEKLYERAIVEERAKARREMAEKAIELVGDIPIDGMCQDDDGSYLTGWDAFVCLFERKIRASAGDVSNPTKAGKE